MSTVVTPAPQSAAPTHSRTGSVVNALVHSTWVAAGVALVILAFVWGQSYGNQPLKYVPDALQNLANTFAPLIAIALFIERAVEVLVSTWRDAGAQDLLHAATTAAGLDAAQAQRAQAIYKTRTRVFAFILSFTLSAITAMAGVRALAPLVSNAPRDGVFYALDVVMTALLLAGGADGLHQIVTTFTQFMDSTKAKMVPAQPTPPATPPAP